MSPTIWIPWAIAILAIIGTTFLTPYHTFFLTTRHGKLEKNIALREKLLESERSRELDYLIAKQTKNYVEKSLRKEITPHPIIVITIWVLTFFTMLFALAIVRLILPKNIPFVFSIPQNFSINIWYLVVLFVVFLWLRNMVSKKAKEIDFSYGYYAAHLGALDGTFGEEFRTPDGYLLRIPKRSLDEKNSIQEIISHERIYVHDKANASFYVFKRYENSRKSGVEEVKILNTIIDKNDIMIFNYSYEKLVLADTVLEQNEKILIIPKFEPAPDFIAEERYATKFKKIKDKFGLKQTLKFNSTLSSQLVEGIRKEHNGQSYWQQDKTVELSDGPAFRDDDGYPVFH